MKKNRNRYICIVSVQIKKKEHLEIYLRMLAQYDNI